MFYSRVEFLVHVLKDTNEKAPNDLSLTSRFTFEIVSCLSVKQRENMTCISIFKGYFHVPPSSRDQRYLRIILIFAQCHLKKKKVCVCFHVFKYSLHMAVRLENGSTPVCHQQCTFTAPH